MNALPPITVEPSHLARTLVRQLPLATVAKLIVSLVNEVEGELQEGWFTMSGGPAEGSLEMTDLSSAAEAFADYARTLHHVGDEPIVDEPLSYAQLGLRRG